MPIVDVPFPKSSLPGQQPGDGQGRLLNTFCEIDAGVPTWRAVPGFALFCDTTLSSPRGFINKSGLLYAAFENTVVTVTENAVVTALTGTLSGTNPVTWARNNKSPTPDLVLVSENGAFTVTSSAVSSFADPDLPQPNSVASLAGFILWTTRSGRIYSSGLNDITVDPLAFTQCQSNPDGLLRGFVKGRQFYAGGDSSIEVYDNVGASPFPLQLVEVIPVGLINQWAVAGFEDGWDREVMLVAADGTVRRLDGYTATVVSTKDVERAIAGVVDKRTIKACVHVVGGHPVFSLSSLTWTWEFNLATGLWHERASYGIDRWRGTQSVNFGGSWMVGDTTSGKIYRVTESSHDEDGGALVMTLESGPIKQFPNWVFCKSVWFDFSTGEGLLVGSDDAVNPSVTVRWSIDGGATWSNGLNRRSMGSLGQFGKPIRVNVNRAAGQSGIRFQLTSSSPVSRLFRGARADVEMRRPA